MRKRNLLREVLPLVLVIPLVMLSFRLIGDRRIAASVAGILFVLVPLVLMLLRWRRVELVPKGPRILWWVGVLQFWLLFALPILGARLLYWETPFEEFTFFGVPGPQWHGLSSKSYMVMLVAVLIAALWPPRKKI